MVKGTFHKWIEYESVVFKRAEPVSILNSSRDTKKFTDISNDAHPQYCSVGRIASDISIRGTEHHGTTSKR